MNAFTGISISPELGDKILIALFIVVLIFWYLYVTREND